MISAILRAFTAYHDGFRGAPLLLRYVDAGEPVNILIGVNYLHEGNRAGGSEYSKM